MRIVADLKRVYLSLSAKYGCEPATFLNAGRIIRFAEKVSSSIRCAHQPATRATAKSGV